MANDLPYGSFNVIVSIDGVAVGGFSEVSGLGSDATVAVYRDGNDAARKIPGRHKVGSVTLKRGIVATALRHWLQDVRDGRAGARRTVSITLLDEARRPVQVWQLHDAMPIKHTGPALAAKGSDVAIEELVLSCEGLDVAPP